MCVDCEADENPMFLYTIYESDEEEESDALSQTYSPPASPGFHLDLSSLAPPRFSFQNYSSSAESSSTFLSETFSTNPSFENIELDTPVSTPGSFTSMMKERKGYIFESPRELQDYFPAYLSPQSVDPELKRSSAIRIPRTPSSNPASIFMEVDAISAEQGSPQSPRLLRPTSLRSSYTPKSS
ncbi:hypothetical protein TWF694_010043 [Orbilia ellipsospora]|uniref:Uncharacterized protein n=1 Tax=Orbilia ellipsospora TaxID=2528407 RepID=A0AAV9X8R6_9PEZI